MCRPGRQLQSQCMKLQTTDRENKNNAKKPVVRCPRRSLVAYLLTFPSYPLQPLSGQIQPEDLSDKYRKQVPPKNWHIATSLLYITSRTVAIFLVTITGISYLREICIVTITGISYLREICIVTITGISYLRDIHSHHDRNLISQREIHSHHHRNLISRRDMQSHHHRNLISQRYS